MGKSAEVVVSCASASLKGAQKNYHITRLEALAFIWACGTYNYYLSSKPFIWRSDHKALKWIFTSAKCSVPALARYALAVEDYSFAIEWIPGTKMIADPFSRMVIIPTGKRAMTNKEMVTGQVKHLLKIDSQYCGFRTEKPEEEIKESILELDINNMDEELIYREEERYKGNGIPSYAIGIDENRSERLITKGVRPNTLTMNLKRMRSLLTKEQNITNDENVETIHDEDDPQLLGAVSIDQEEPTAREKNQLKAVYYIRGDLEGNTMTRSISKEIQREIRLLARKCRILDDELARIHKGVLVRKVLITETERRRVLVQMHEGMGHRGAFSVLRNLSSRYWFPAMERLVARHIARCIECQRYASSDKRITPFYPLETNDVFAHWYIDFGGPYPETKEGFKYAIIAVDSVTRWAEVIPAKEATAEVAANFLYENIICRGFGVKSIHSDNGAHFVNVIIENLTKICK